MVAKFNICKNGACGIQVSGLEKEMDQYLDSPLVSFRDYAFEHTVTLNIVSTIASDQSEEVESYSLVPHIDIDIDNIELSTDGLKRVDHIILPNSAWFQYIRERDITALDEYTNGVYFLGDADLFLKFKDGELEEVTLLEILEINQTNTTLIKESLHTFGMCHIEECFFKLCMYLLNNMPCTDPCFNDKMKSFKGDILNRDIVWMILNAIKYCLESQLFYRALKLLEQLQTCWGICKDIDNTNSTLYKGCGCNS